MRMFITQRVLGTHLEQTTRLCNAMPNLSALSIQAGEAGEKRKVQDDFVTPTPKHPHNRPLRSDVEEFMQSEDKDLSGLLRIISSRLTDMTTALKCKSPLVLIHIKYMDIKDGLRDCAPKNLEEFKSYTPYLSEDYIVLRTGTGCDLSAIGMDFGNADYIEISSDTAPRQREKGYNTLMRAIAVIIAFFYEKPLMSFVANPLSAYALLTKYETKVLEWTRPRENSPRRVRPETYDAPLSRDDAMKVKDQVATLSIPPSDRNFKTACSVIESGVQCAERAVHT